LISISSIFEDEDLKEKAIDFSNDLSGSLKKMIDENEADDLKKKVIDVERETRHFFKKVKELFKNFSFITVSSGRRYHISDFDSRYNKKKRKRAASYCFNIFWSLLVLILINFYKDFIAYFQIVSESGTFAIRHFPLITNDFDNIIVILNAALVISIVSNIILLNYDNYKFNRIMHIITNTFFILALANIIYFFPFRLAVLPYGFIVPYLEDAVKIILSVTVFILGIQIIIDFIKIVRKTKKNEELF
jgi:hypothetical protein